MTQKKGVLLINLGTPNSTSVADVRKYLNEFLIDKRVIDIPLVFRWLLVNLIIVPFRSPKSAREYQKIFTERGSPLKYYTEDCAQLLSESLSQDYTVKYAMRYQNPSIKEAIYTLEKKDIESLHVIPLFPQYASATTGSIVEEVMRIYSKKQVIPEIHFTSQFYTQQLFIECIKQNAQKLMKNTQYDHFLFSYHGLPQRQVKKSDKGNFCQMNDQCCSAKDPRNTYCYRSQCFHTSQLIAESLHLSKEDYTVCFQSRLGRDEWIQPYMENVVNQLNERGIKHVLIFSPSFVSDCLETTVELGETYAEKFLQSGGITWTLVPSLNTSSIWIDCLKQIVVNN